MTRPGLQARHASLPHVRALDGVRGAAVMAVLLFHAGHLTGGWLGVDLFFVLSGFLITSLLLAERRQRHRISLGAFWARRARRLLPALCLLLIGVGVYALVWAAPRELDRIRADGLATLGYVANWHQIAQGNSYWDLFRAPSPLQHTWSLAIEEQFYLLWPLVLVALLAWRRSTRAVLVASLIGIVTSFGAMFMFYRPGADPQRVFLGTDTRASSILLGAALAAVVTSNGWAERRRTRVALEVLGVTGAAFLGWAWLHLSGGTPAVYEGLLLACSAAAVLVIAAAAHPARGVLARALSFRPLCALGVISYGVYLWHWPVDLVASRQRVGFSGWPLAVVQVTITLGIALASYVIVESPIRRGAFGGWGIRLLTPVAAVACVAVVLVSTIPTSSPHGNPAAALRRLTGTTEPTSAAFSTATSIPWPRARFRLMVTGDSVAYRLAPAFLALQGEFGYTTIVRTTPGCALERGATGRRLPADTPPIAVPNCSAAWADDVARDRPDVVLVSLVGPVGGDWQIGGQWVHPCDAVYDWWFEQQVADGLSQLVASGARVALALPVPSTEQLREQCLRADETRAVLSVRGAYLIDFEALVCPHGQCVSEIDGIVLREDRVHYQGPAAELVVRWLGPQLQSLATAGPA